MARLFPETLTKDTASSLSGFFLVAKNAYSVQGKTVSEPTEFVNCFEGTSYRVLPGTGDIILKGPAGELWRAPYEQVRDTYTKPDGSKVRLSDFVPDIFVNLMTGKTDFDYFACHVPLSVHMRVITAWGDELETNREGVAHGEGDYVVCRKGKDNLPDFSDIWVVNGLLFPHTYILTHLQ